MLLKICLAVFSAFIVNINAAVWNHVNKDCATCYCPANKNLVCTIIRDNKKAPPTYKTFHNDCEYVCYAACNEEKVKFVYCGECDNRPLLPRGSKGKPNEMTPCLNFTIIPGPGMPGAIPDITEGPITTSTLAAVTVPTGPPSGLPAGAIVLGYMPGVEDLKPVPSNKTNSIEEYCQD